MLALPEELIPCLQHNTTEREREREPWNTPPQPFEQLEPTFGELTCLDNWSSCNCKATMIHFSTVLIIGQIIIAIYRYASKFPMPPVYHLMTSCLSLVDTNQCSLIPTIEDQATWARLCDASVHRNSLLLVQWKLSLPQDKQSSAKSHILLLLFDQDNCHLSRYV